MQGPTGATGSPLGGVRRGPARWVVAALLVALALPTAPVGAQTAPTDPSATALAPVTVALEALPGAMRLAVLEVDDQLTATQARRELEDLTDFVDGFAAVPEGSAALREPGVREAYAWTEAVVETLLALPAEMEHFGIAAAACEARSTAAGTPEAVIARGLGSARRLDALTAEIDALLSAPPRSIDPAPVNEARGILADWFGPAREPVQSCLLAWADALGLLGQADPSPDELVAVAVPDPVHRTAVLRVFGGGPPGQIVHVAAPGLDLHAATVAGPTGHFRVSHAVPRDAPLGAHALHVSTLGHAVEVRVNVTLAPTTLHVDAPTQVAPGGRFTVRVAAHAPPGTAEVDRAAVRATWRDATHDIRLSDGSGALTLPADAAGNHVLRLEYPGTDVLAAASAEVRIRVSLSTGMDAPRDAPRDGGIDPLLDRLGPFTDLLPWLLAILAVVAAVLAGRSLHRRRGPATPAFAAEPWPQSPTLVAAVGALFALLRRLGLVAPGTTVREWARDRAAPDGLAPRFEADRYGPPRPQAEPPTGLIAWVREAWTRARGTGAGPAAQREDDA